MGYNERLFSSGLRKHLHLARFRWVTQALTHLHCHYDSVLELGCFDGKILDFLPTPPRRYVGYDANWEGGLDLARQRWGAVERYVFRQCQVPDEMELADEQFDVVICMDTLEHVPPELVDPYLAVLTNAMQAYFLVTVPNEKGIVFCTKYLLKKLCIGRAQPYSFREFTAATLGKLEGIARHEHKGFDYDALIRSIARHCRVIQVSGYPFSWLPPMLNFGVGIIGQRLEAPE